MSDEAGVDRSERAARNQALFREVNERLEGIAETFQFVADHAVFVCECADVNCSGQVMMTADEYDAVRARGNTFVIMPGHVLPDIEHVVESNDRFEVVAKVGKAGRIAEAVDDRST